MQPRFYQLSPQVHRRSRTRTHTNRIRTALPEPKDLSAIGPAPPNLIRYLLLWPPSGAGGDRSWFPKAGRRVGEQTGMTSYHDRTQQRHPALPPNAEKSRLHMSTVSQEYALEPRGTRFTHRPPQREHGTTPLPKFLIPHPGE